MKWALVLCGLGLVLYAHGLGLAESGLWPACVGTAALLLGLSLAVFPERASARGQTHNRVQSCVQTCLETLPRSRRPALAAFFLACLLWMALLPYGGWMVSSALALGLAARGAGNSPAKSVLIVLCVLALLYLGFEVLMPHSLPAGSLFTPGGSS